MDFVAAQYAALADPAWFDWLASRLTAQGVVDRVVELGGPRLLHVDQYEVYIQAVQAMIRDQPTEAWASVAPDHR